MSFIASVTDENVDLSSFIPVIKVIGVGGAGSNAIPYIMGLEGIQCAVANTDAQSLILSPCKTRIQLGRALTAGLGAGALPEIGKKAALESKEEIISFLNGTNMVFLTAGMGGGTGTGATPVIAQIAREMGILTVAVVTKPFNFEGYHRIELAEQGVQDLVKYVDTIIVVANQKLFRVSNENTTFTDAFKMADDVLYGGVKCITDLITMPGLINLDFADIRTIMSNMGYAMMGSSEASGEGRATTAIEMAITNPLLENVSLEGAKGVLVNITGGPDLTLFEVNDIVARIQERIDKSTRLIFGAIFDHNMEGKISVSVVATGVNSIDKKDNQVITKNPSSFKQEELSSSISNSQMPEKSSSNANKPPYMQSHTSPHSSSKSEIVSKQSEEYSSYKEERKVDNPQYTEHSLSYAATREENRLFDNDIESDIIDALGGEEFLASPGLNMTRDISTKITNNADLRYAKYKSTFEEFDNIEGSQSYSQFPITNEKKNIITKENHHKHEQLEEESIKKTSIFSRMAEIIKEKHKDYKDSDQKKKLNDTLVNNELPIESNKFKIQTISRDRIDGSPKKIIPKDKIKDRNGMLSGGFFAVIEDDELRND